MMIMSKPDNIPTLIQIIGRSVRNNSYAYLPPEMRNVYIRIYTSSLSDGSLSYEEFKYGENTGLRDYSRNRKDIP